MQSVSAHLSELNIHLSIWMDESMQLWAAKENPSTQHLNWNKLQNVILLLKPFIVGNNIMNSFSRVWASARAREIYLCITYSR